MSLKSYDKKVLHPVHEIWTAPVLVGVAVLVAFLEDALGRLARLLKIFYFTNVSLMFRVSKHIFGCHRVDHKESLDIFHVPCWCVVRSVFFQRNTTPLQRRGVREKRFHLSKRWHVCPTVESEERRRRRTKKFDALLSNEFSTYGTALVARPYPNSILVKFQMFQIFQYFEILNLLRSVEKI